MFASRRQWWTLGVLCLAALLVVVDNTIVNVALPILSRRLGASNSSLQWVVDAYSLPFAGLLLAGGPLADLWGRKRVMGVAVACFGFLSLVASRAHDVETLVFCRALMGAAAAFIFPTTLSILILVFRDPKQRARALGLWGATVGVAIAVGPVCGGAVLVHFWYGSVFLVNVPLAIVTLIGLRLFVVESRDVRKRPVDGWGLVFGTAGITALTWAIIEGPSWHWQSRAEVEAVATSVVLLVCFAVRELRCSHPLFDLRHLGQRSFSTSVVAIAANFFCLFGFIFLITQYFQSVRGYSALSAGLHTLPFAITVVLLTPLGVAWAQRFGPQRVVASGLVVTTLALVTMNFLAARSAFFGPVVIVMVALAIGFSLVNAPSTSELMRYARADDVSALSSVNETIRELAGSLGVAVLGSAFASSFSSGVTQELHATRGETLTRASRIAAMTSVQAAMHVARLLPVPERSLALHRIQVVFMRGLHHASLIGAGVALVAAIFVVFPSTRDVPPHADSPSGTADMYPSRGR